MKLMEKLLYSILLFLFSYIVLSVGLRAFDITDSYSSHMIGGISGTVLGMGLFLFLLVKKQ
jgi:hypothetical protein